MDLYVQIGRRWSDVYRYYRAHPIDSVAGALTELKKLESKEDLFNCYSAIKDWRMQLPLVEFRQVEEAFQNRSDQLDGIRLRSGNCVLRPAFKAPSCSQKRKRNVGISLDQLLCDPASVEQLLHWISHAERPIDVHMLRSSTKDWRARLSQDDQLRVYFALIDRESILKRDLNQRGCFF